MEKILVGSHVFAGVSALVFGLASLGYGIKGGWAHRLLGKAYFYSMAWIFASSALVLFLYRFNSFLLFISIFSFYLAFSGYRVTKCKALGSHKRMDWVAAIAAISMTAAVAAVSAYQVYKTKAGLTELLSFFFGVICVQFAAADIKKFRAKGPYEPRWWLYHHISAMTGSFIAAVTAFLVQNGSRIVARPDFQWIFWVTPTILGTMHIRYMIGKYKRPPFRLNH